MKRLVLTFASCLALSGCLEEQRYIVENQSVALTEDTAPAYLDEDDNPVFVVERRFSFPIKPPQDQTLTSLTQRAQGMMPALPFPRLPWVEETDLELELDYVLANLGDEPLVAMITLDGINEFHAYTPGPEDFHQWERRIALEPRARVTGTITELEMAEVAIDLATVVNQAPNSNLVVTSQSQSGRDPRVRPFIPAVVPSLVALRVGIVSTQAANVVLEISVRAQDHGDRLADRGTSAWELPEPMPFVPVVPEMD